MKKKIDVMLLATFLTTVFYSATYPYIHKEIVSNVSDSIIALNRIINCLSIIFFCTLWNKESDRLFKIFPVFCIGETFLGVLLTIWATTTHDIVAYYIIDTLIFAVVTRNICCGGVKLRAVRYNSETEREHFDNKDNSTAAVATIIGSVIAMALELDFAAMLWIATFGSAIDNIFYLHIFRNTQR